MCRLTSVYTLWAGAICPARRLCCVHIKHRAGHRASLLVWESRCHFRAVNSTLLGPPQAPVLDDSTSLGRFGCGHKCNDELDISGTSMPVPSDSEAKGHRQCPFFPGIFEPLLLGKSLSSWSTCFFFLYRSICEIHPSSPSEYSRHPWHRGWREARTLEIDSRRVQKRSACARLDRLLQVNRNGGRPSTIRGGPIQTGSELSYSIPKVTLAPHSSSFPSNNHHRRQLPSCSLN